MSVYSKFKGLPYYLAACFFSSSLFFSVLASTDYGFGSFENAFQIGVELDDNIFKTFRTGDSDGLLRLLIKTKREITTKRSRFNFGVQAGGKKYFTHPEQDTAIGQLDLSWLWQATDKVQFKLSNETKGQFESNSTDAALSDINEDYVANTTRLSVSYALVEKFRQSIYGKFNFFTFFGDLAIDYVQEHVGTTISRPIVDNLSGRVGYEFTAGQFPNSPAGDREDTQHEVSVGLNYYGGLLASLGYAYQDNNSTQAFFSSTAHKVTALLSFAFASADRFRDEDDVTIHLLGTIQIRQYPSVFFSDEEGQRFLFSNSEDNNFNTLTFKITKRLYKTLSVEFKFSRYTNELSDREDPFERNLYLIGLRASF